MNIIRTINISTVIGGVADALPTKLSRKLLGGCACLGLLLLSCPVSQAVDFATLGWSDGDGDAVAGDWMPNPPGLIGLERALWARGGPFAGVSVLIWRSQWNMSTATARIRDGDKEWNYDVLIPGLMLSVADAEDMIKWFVTIMNTNAPEHGFSGTWSYVPSSPSGSLGNLVYTSLITTTHVAIDIKPGSPENTVKLGSQGLTQVAILGSEDFDATQVDPLTVQLADATVRVKGNGQAQTTVRDTNGDGFLDLVLHVESEGFSLTDGDVSATLTGTTFGGEDIEGEDLVRVIP